ncbi:MAG: hypothetical protein ACI35S_03295 [Anaeroplasma sp.]
MQPIEIIVIITSVIIVATVFGNYIYKKVNHISTECNSCHSAMKRALKKVDKDLKKEINNKNC